MAAQGHDVAACKQVDGGITAVFQLLGKRWSGPIRGGARGPAGALRRPAAGDSGPQRAHALRPARRTRRPPGWWCARSTRGPPLRVSYRLTESGAALEPALKALGQWAQTHLPDADPAWGPPKLRGVRPEVTRRRAERTPASVSPSRDTPRAARLLSHSCAVAAVSRPARAGARRGRSASTAPPPGHRSAPDRRARTSSRQDRSRSSHRRRRRVPRGRAQAAGRRRPVVRRERRHDARVR